MVVGTDRIALCGALDAIGVHRHATAAVVVGVDAPLRFVAERTHVSRAALLAPGFTHAVEATQGAIAVFLLPPHVIGAPVLPVIDAPDPGSWIELAAAVSRDELRSFEPIDHQIRQQLRGRGRRAPATALAAPLDDRVLHATAAIADALDDNLPVEALAARVGVSPSRLMALVRAQLGTSLRGYRRWLRMFQVARAYATGASLTTGALDAGFASSAHLSAASREQFGIKPSQLLAPRTRCLLRVL